MFTIKKVFMNEMDAGGGSGELDAAALSQELTEMLAQEYGGQEQEQEQELGEGDETGEESGDDEAANAGTEGTESPENPGEKGTETDHLVKPPSTWRAEAKAEWDNLPQKAKEEILKREQEIFSGIESYKEKASLGERVEKAFGPLMETFKQSGIPIEAEIQELASAHVILSLGSTEQKVNLIQGLAQRFNVPLQVLLGDGVDGDEEGIDAFNDPIVKSLQAKVADLENQLKGVTTATHQQKVQTVQQQIDAFKAKPEAEFFDEVIPEMEAVIRAGQAKSIEDAYKKAVKLNEKVSGILSEREVARKLEEQKKVEEARVAAAKSKTNATITGNRVQGNRGTAKPSASLDQALSAAFDQAVEKFK